MKDHSNITKMHFWMTRRAKYQVFGHFQEFGLLDWLGIAYCDSAECFTTCDKCTRSCWIIQNSWKSIFEWYKEPKKPLDWLHIAYFDVDKQCTWFGHGIKFCDINYPKVNKLKLIRSQKVMTGTEVEHAAWQRYSSQRQLRLDLLLLVRWFVGPSVIFLENRAQDFSDFLHECSLL